MDNPSPESSELSIDAAATEFATLFEQKQEEPEKPQKVDTEVDPPEKKEETSEDSQATEDDAEEDDAPITVPVDGKLVTLTKAQIAEHYKNGLRQADYTRKTMAAAEQVKTAEAETQKAQQERIAYAQNLQKMAAQLEGAIQQQEKIDWDALIEQNPVEALRQQHLLQKRQAALQENRQEQAQMAERFKAEQAENLRAHLATQQEQLLAKLPEWKDEAKANSERDALKSYLKEQGYEESDVASINDHRAVILGRKAMLYDQMMAKAKVAAKKVANVATKVERPGVASERNPLDGRTSAMQRLSKTGSIDDAARLFANLL